MYENVQKFVDNCIYAREKRSTIVFMPEKKRSTLLNNMWQISFITWKQKQSCYQGAMLTPRDYGD